jgi:hypothetical protein
VCFTGTLQTRVQGRLIEREQAEALPRAAGLVVHERVTKALDVLVVADPDSLLRSVIYGIAPWTVSDRSVFVCAVPSGVLPGRPAAVRAAEASRGVVCGC